MKRIKHFNLFLVCLVFWGALATPLLSQEKSDADWLGGSALKNETTKRQQDRPVKNRTGTRLAKEPVPFKDLLVTTLDLDVDTLTKNLVWSDDGNFLFTLSKSGRLRKISIPDFVELESLDMKTACSYLGRCKFGLVVVQTDQQQVVTLSMKNLTIKKKIQLPASDQLACSPGSDQGIAIADRDVFMLDLKRGKIIRQFSTRDLKGDHLRVKRTTSYVPATGFDHCVMSPDGKYIFSSSQSMIQRVAIGKIQLSVEEFSPSIGSNIQQIVISPDGKYVAMPSGGGNRDGAPGHKKMSYGTYVYKVDNLQQPVLEIESGSYPMALAFDKPAARVYAHNRKNQLIVFKPNGQREAEYNLSGKSADVYRILVHPKGYRLLILTDTELIWVHRNDAERASGRSRPGAERKQSRG